MNEIDKDFIKFCEKYKDRLKGLSLEDESDFKAAHRRGWNAGKKAGERVKKLLTEAQHD